jgi:enoyl-CoA hydratase/carnithine racemase
MRVDELSARQRVGSPARLCADGARGSDLRQAATGDFRMLLDREAITHLRCGLTEDHREGVAAFLEKREPRFQGR